MAVLMFAQPWHQRNFAPALNPQTKGTCSTVFETGCKPVLLLIAQGCLAWLTAPNEQMETLKCGDSISGNV